MPGSTSRLLWLGALCCGLLACAAEGPPPLDLSGSDVQVPPIARSAELRALLDPDRYEELHEVLERYRVAATRDIEHGEEPLILAYEAFAVANNDLLGKLDAWVKRRPRSWHAHTARAFCRLELAYVARGTGWGKDLSRQQVTEMEKHHAAATADARQALKLQPRSVAAHHVLLAIARHGTTVDFDSATEQALEAFPASYQLRFDTVWSLQPRWKGGANNFSVLDEFVRDSQAYAAQNPRLRRLLAMPYWARGLDRAKDRDYAGAIGLYNAAIAIAEDRLFLGVRAQALAANRDFDKALADARRYLELQPPTGDGVGADPLLETILKEARGWVAGNLYFGHVREALATLDKALKHAPDDGALNLARATARCRSGDVTGALQDFERALGVAKDPAHVARLKTACIASGGDPITAILRAQSRLLQAPGLGDAQFELGALYDLVADVHSAVTAYRVACELRVRAACNRIEGLRQIGQAFPTMMPREFRASWTLHEQERLSDPGKQPAFFAALEASGNFPAGGAPPVFIDRPVPEFPMWARSAKAGSVTMLIYFNKDGTVAGAKVEGSEPQGYFELAALRTVLRWRIESRQTGLKARQRMDFKLPPDKPIDPAEHTFVALR